MKFAMAGCALILVVALSIHERANACKLATNFTPTDLALAYETRGPEPVLLIAFGDQPTLLDDANNTIAIEPEPAFDDVDFPQTTRAFRPVEPLSSGRHRWTNGHQTVEFFVDATLQRQPVATDATVRLVRNDGDGCSEDSCADVNRTRLELAYRSVDGDFALMEVTTSKARQVKFVSARSEDDAREFGFFDFELDASIAAQRVCVALTPVSADGVGERVDLGCIDAKNDEGIIVNDGCSSAHATNAYALLLAGLVLALRRRSLTPLHGQTTFVESAEWEV